MARVLYDGLVEYEDGTPATTSQMAKDVVEFLNWAAEPEMDQRKKMGVATVTITSVLLALSIWVKRYTNVFFAVIIELLANTSQVQMGTHQDPKDRVQPSSSSPRSTALISHGHLVNRLYPHWSYCRSIPFSVVCG